MADDAPDREAAENWALVNTPLGEPWSGRTRYAAAMFFYKRGEMTAETLEVYRICSRLDAEDPLPIIGDRGVGKDWLKRMGSGGSVRLHVTGTVQSGKHAEHPFTPSEPCPTRYTTHCSARMKAAPGPS
jgi:hypothetical protein